MQSKGIHARPALVIGGFLPLSLNDFPGHVAAVIFLQGCNFRCPFCHNPALLPRTHPAAAGGTPAYSESGVLEALNRRRRLLDGVVISGGEPTCQSGLEPFLKAIRTLGLAIKLDTNGSYPQVLARLFDRRLVDMVAMDIKAPWTKYGQLAGCAAPIKALQRSIALIAASGLQHQFRTTVVRPLLAETDLAAIRAMVPTCSPYRLQAFVPDHSLDPALRCPAS